MIDENLLSPPAIEQIQEAASKLEIRLPDDQLRQIDRYRRFLWYHNQTHNLTRHLDVETFVNRDLLDTWRVSQLIESGQEVLDIGTGGGVPGLPLAILRDDLTVSVCESVQKKARVIESMVDQLGLPVAIFATRAEDLFADFRFDVCTLRAVGSISKICRFMGDYWMDAGRVMCIKGPKWRMEMDEAESAGLTGNVQWEIADTYEMPGTESQSTIIVFTAKRAPQK